MMSPDNPCRAQFLLAATYQGVPINLHKLSRITRISPNHLSKIFSGHVQPSLAAARAITEALETTLDEFVVELDNKRIERKRNLARWRAIERRRLSKLI